MKIISFWTLLFFACINTAFADNVPTDVDNEDVVAEIDFSELAPVASIASDDNYIYVNTNSRKVSRLVLSEDGLQIDKTSAAIGASGQKIKCIAENGDYLYVAIRGNGYGMHNDSKYPEWLFSFEQGLDEFTTDFDLFDSYSQKGTAKLDETGEPSPARWNHSLRMIKGAGDAEDNQAILKKAWDFGQDAFFSLWIKEQSTNSENVRIPVLTKGEEVTLAIVINSEKLIGVEFNGITEFTSFKIGEQWNNVRINVTDSKATLFVRDWNLGDWTSVDVEGNLNADAIAMGIITDAEDVEVLIDDFAYNSTNLGEVLNLNGALVVIKKSTMKVVNSINFDMRALDIFIDKEENKLYLGCIGGFNIYDISQPTSPKLLGYCHEADRTWTYVPASKTSNYHFKAKGEEVQKIKVDSYNGRKYLVAGQEAFGVGLYDVTNPSKPFRIVVANSVPNVKCLNASNKTSNQPQYSQWGVVFEYPYVYATVASYMTFQHNEYFDGDYTLVDDSNIVYGIMVIDISDTDDIQKKIIPLPQACYPTYINAEGDAQPTILTADEHFIYGNLSDKGIMIFRKDGMESQFVGCRQMPGNGRSSALNITNDGRLIVGEGVVGKAWNERKLFVLDFTQSFDVSVGETQFTSYVTTGNTEFNDVKAYIVTQANASGVTLQEVKAAPQATPVIINAPQGNYKLVRAFDTDNVDDNLLIPGDGSTAGDGKTIYALGLNKSTGEAAFCLVADGLVIPQDKGYLVVSDADAKEYLGMSEGQADGIYDIVRLNVKGNSRIYNISGQTMAKPTKGLNIIDGKKVFIK